ncbi:hypothetical protein ANOM_009499 [Aspergillus nomiae NRRL 13137]|uniref:Uncharacterized protein n=1 Tax=Aspergillus nomiae NRRL (strain ATCC 15546 / NRRL 13137 / CBS 260.88 / M93) TaxID=1509407 RepID=A0A0L1IXW4_ASPN3|nr:uncharacterized protein ANOM_009499 [Aspergillus nomiae NRRL 13137]KNG84344.1 hypothetical protein ANOM_009499 [Aspergillus nomiae NRRL 13137]
MNEIAAAPTMSAQEDLDQRSGETHSEPAQVDGAPHDSDDEPMVYEIPHDYAVSARQERDHLLAAGVSPDSVILQSEIGNQIPQVEGESPADFAKRYAETMNDMIAHGVCILNDQCIADAVPSGFETIDGKFFDLGPGSGATKGEFREFSRWFDETLEAGQMHEVPEKWLKFEKPAERRFDL